MKRKRVRLLLAIVCLFTIIAGPLTAGAQQDTVIRVGIFDYKAFYGTDAQGNPYGYGYEYLNTLAAYGGFRYEYVYGTWSECLEWLASGKIDMLDSAQKSADRQDRFLFSEYSTGMSYGELFVRADNTTILYNDFSAMDGLTVGMLAENSRNSTFAAHAAANGFSVETVLFQAEADLSASLQNGTVEAIVSSNLRQGKNERPVTRFSPTPFFLMFHRDNTPLKTAVDAALEHILVDDPNYNTALWEKYYGLDDTAPTLTRDEQRFIQDTPPLRVVYSADWAPFAFSDSGTPRGIAVDILNLIGDTTGLRFTYLESDSQEQAASLIVSGQADLLLGFEATVYKQADLKLVATDAFLSAPLCLIGKNQEVGDHAVFAVPQSSEEMIWLLKDQFPSSSITVLDTAELCYQAVLSGQADFTMDNIYTATDAIGSGKGRNLAIAFVSPVKGYYAFGLRQNADPALARVLNKGIASVSQAEQSSIFARYTVNITSEAPLSSLLYAYRIPLAVVLGILLALCAVAALLFWARVKKRRQALWQMAYIDPLTGIGNLKLFEEELRARLDKHPDTKYVVCQFDIENLKLLNEIYGFASGDKLLRDLADEIRAMSNAELDTYARISGDDFIVLKSYTRLEQNRQLLREGEQRIQARINRQFNCLVKLKFGMYYIQDNTEDVSAILEKANYAHSICKSNPTISRYRYNEDDKQSAIEEKRIEARMEEALAQNQFALYLQPKYRLSDESLAGAEALVRWYNGESHEPVYPNSFIPLFERNGFITQLDMYMLEQVCRLIHTWLEQGKEPTTISINFSRLHLLNPSFTRDICAMADRYQVPRKYLEIELTESAMFDNEEAMFAVLESLHEEGFTLSMDDFGTGYSSLGLLKNLPVDVIKIDRSFFLNSRFKTRARAVIENVMQMAKRLEIHTVAEGVESQEHIDMLREMGCEIVQGYYYSRPVPVSEFRLDGKAQPSRIPHVEPRVEVESLGDLALGRVDLGEMTSVLAYRLYQVSMRKILYDTYGEGEMIFTLRSAGKLSGSMFAREHLDLSLPFEDFLLDLGDKLSQLKIAHLAVERLDLDTCGAVITLSDDLDCSGMLSCDQTLCQYDEGFLTGVMKEYTQKNYSVIETDCWGTGASFCRFELKPK